MTLYKGGTHTAVPLAGQRAGGRGGGGRPPRVSGQRPEHPTKFTDPIYEIAMEKLFGKLFLL